jgi:hypothetical protein
VPYPDIREEIGIGQSQFVNEWMISMNRASDDYTKRIRMMWKRIFDDIFTSSAASRRQSFDSGISTFEDEHRGLPR